MKRISVLMFLALCAGSALAQKVAVVDESAVLNSLPESKKIEGELQALIQSWADTSAAYTKLITDRTERFKQNSSTLTNAQRKVELDTINFMQRSLNDYALSKQANNVGELARERVKRYGPIIEKYRAAVAKVAKREGYDIVVNKISYYYISASTNDLSEKLKKELKE
jgi:Skp family chaperone for outer membrane proteins